MDVLAQCASLANDFGATKGPNAATEFDLELWIGDPDGTGAEVTPTTVTYDEVTDTETTVANGYAPALVANNGTNFPPADPDTGELTTPVLSGFPTSTAEYPGTVTHWLLRDRATGAAWQRGEIPRAQRITVDAAGVTPRLVLTIFYNPLGSSGDLA